MAQAARLAAAGLASAVAALVASAEAAAAPVTGVVLVDRDGDGRRSAADEPVAGARVSFEGGPAVAAGADGGFVVEVPRPGIVWVHGPDGTRPGPTWAAVQPGQAAPVELLLVPRPWGAPATFAHVSDVHIGDIAAEAARHAFAQVAGSEPRPDFVVGTGDLTARSTAEDFAGLDQALAGLPPEVPFVPVAGNHDWHDGGGNYRARFGPPQYSFDAGGVRFVVVNFNAGPGEQIAFVQAALADWPRERRAVVARHGPPDDAMARAFVAAGADLLLTGHVHSNRVIVHRHDGAELVELNTQTLAMGGDYTPAGYRLVRVDEGARGGFAVTHHTTVEAPVIELTHPRDGECVGDGPLALTAAIERGAPPRAVAVRIDGGPWQPLAPAGGWSWQATVAAPAWGPHRAELVVDPGTPEEARREARFCVETAARRLRGGEWAQFGRTAARTGAQDRGVRPPLRTAWIAAAGGHQIFGSPVVSRGIVVAPLADFAGGGRGGLAAFDLATGARRWEAALGAPVLHAPAVDGDTVFVLDSEGRVHALELESGQTRWRSDITAGLVEGDAWTSAGVVALSGLVVASVQERAVALDAATGAERWRHVGTRQGFALTRAALVAGDDEIVAIVGRAPTQVVVLELDGRVRWQWEVPRPRVINVTPVLAGDALHVLVVDGKLHRFDVKTGKPGPVGNVFGGKGDAVTWANGPLGGMALVGDVIVFPSPRGLYGARRADGAKLWQREPPRGAIRMMPASATPQGYLAAPAATGGLVWVGGVDGMLRAVDARSGHVTWSTSLGVPLVSGIAAAGDALIVAGYDGSLRALVSGYGLPVGPVDPPPKRKKRGRCGAAPGDEPGGAWLVLAALAVAATRRPRYSRTMT